MITAEAPETGIARKLITLYGKKTSVEGHYHKNGGGFIANIAHADEAAFVGKDAMVLEDAQVLGNAQILDKAAILGKAQVRDNAKVSGKVRVIENAQVYGNAKVYDMALVGGNAKIGGSVEAYGTVWLCGDVDVTSGKFFSYKISSNGNSAAPGEYGARYYLNAEKELKKEMEKMCKKIMGLNEKDEKG